MNEKSSSAIVLKSFDYKERERIITLLTKDSGIIKLIVKKISKKNPSLFVLSTPLTLAEFSYVKGRTELYRFLDGSLIDAHLYLRNRLEHLNCAVTLTQLVLRTQMPGKPLSAIFALLRSYLRALSKSNSTLALGSSFALKLLMHDGLLSFDHKPPHFTHNEWEIIYELAMVRAFPKLNEIKCSEALNEKIKKLLEYNYR